jgi:hypothetical protein
MEFALQLHRQIVIGGIYRHVMPRDQEAQGVRELLNSVSDTLEAFLSQRVLAGAVCDVSQAAEGDDPPDHDVTG